MIAYFSEIYHGLISLLVGMGITFREFIKPPVTVAYPYETLTMCARYRGHIELLADDEGNPNCVVCGLCERACPSECISITSVKPEGSKKKVLTGYTLDFTRCSLCGSCVESCNFSAIAFSREYNLASSRKEDFHIDLFKRLEEKKR